MRLMGMREREKGEEEMNKGEGAGDQVGQQAGGTVKASKLSLKRLPILLLPFFVCDLALKLQECGSTALAL